jgi:hypothetical protein
MNLIFHSAELLLLCWILIQTTKIGTKLMKIRIESDTLTALIALAQSAVDADAHDKADLAALQATVANETDLPPEQKAQIDALLNPTPPAPAP